MFSYQELGTALRLDFASAGITNFEQFISSDMTLQEARCASLYQSFYKKLEPSGRSEIADVEALKKFESINASISDDPFEFAIESECDSVFWDYFRDNYLKATTPSDANFDLDYIRETFAAGPGSSLGCKNESFYTKLFNSRITMTDPYLLALYRAAISNSDTWSQAEMQRHKVFGEDVVSGNRLFFVPKTAAISRTCCTEPLLNMFLQKAIGAFLEYCLAKSFGIRLETQPDHNREMARIGSDDGSFGTIDLQSASDSISWRLVQRITGGNLLGYLRLARCESTTLPSGEQRRLRMISTMGNGFTFPLQTLIFACAVRACYQMMNLDSHCPRTQFGVFGDDIVVRKEVYYFLCRMLTKLGFVVNDTKSFNSGSFRESCGHDWFRGKYIRGVYIRSLETVADVYSAINRLTRWSALAGVPLLKSLAVLRSGLKRNRILYVPFSEAVDSGIQVPFDMTKPRVLDNSYWFFFRKLQAVNRRRKVPLSREESLQLGYTDYNQCGWLVTYLGGYARSEDRPIKSEASLLREEGVAVGPSAFLTLRSQDAGVRRKVVRSSIPWWDWPGPEGIGAGCKNPALAFSWSDWKIATAALS